MTSVLTPAWRQYALAAGAFVAVSLLNLELQTWLGYQTIALIYLLAVVLVALVVGRGAILFGTALSAIGWRFLFAPPRFSLSIADSYDEMMFVTYFAVALTVAELMARLRAKHDAELQARLAAESERLGRTLLNAVSHELRTPIAAITSAANSLNAHASLSAEQQELLAEIESAGARLNRVVQNLLSAARLQAGQIRTRLEWCDVSDVISSALGNVRKLAKDRSLDTRLTAGLPLVRADFVLLEQALANLLMNAALHTPTGTPITVSTAASNGEVVIEVADRGPGLAAGQWERLWEPFYRAPGGATGGTGLGLAIVKGFVEAQSGKVSAVPREGGGTVFAIRLPVTNPPTMPDDQP